MSRSSMPSASSRVPGPCLASSRATTSRQVGPLWSELNLTGAQPATWTITKAIQLLACLQPCGNLCEHCLISYICLLTPLVLGLGKLVKSK